MAQALPFTLEEVMASTQYSAAVPTPQFVLTFIRNLARHSAPLVENAVRTFTQANEDALTNILLLPLYMLYPGASRETDKNGHVDIALKQPPFPQIVMTGEAKVLDDNRGFDWYAAGLTKLVSKYNNGRYDVALMVAFCRKPAMYTLIEEYRQRIALEAIAYFEREHHVTELGLANVPGIFATQHAASGRSLRVVHAWVNLFYQTDVDAFASAKEHRKREAQPAV
jgi:hypothetical protein